MTRSTLHNRRRQDRHLFSAWLTIASVVAIDDSPLSWVLNEHSSCSFLITNYAPQVLESSIVHLGLLTAPNDWACNVLLDWWRRRSNLCYCRTVTLTSLSRVQQTANQKLPIHCDRDIAELRIFVLRFILILKLWLVTLTASDSASADHCARL